MTTTIPAKRGRPGIDPAAKRTRSNYTLSPEARRQAERLAAHLGLSKSGVIELALRRLSAQELQEATR